MEAPYRRRITQSLLARIRAWLETLKDNPDLLEDTTAILPEDYRALGAVHAMFMRSCLLGMGAAGKAGRGADFADPLLLPDAPIAALPFEEATAFLRTQIPLTRDAYYALDDKLRLRAFAVGRLTDGDAVNRVKEIIRHNLEQGGTIADFYRMTDDEILNGAGFGKGNMSYWETVYRTNEDAIHNAGRAMGFEADPPAALELVGVNDLRQTEICRRLTQPPFIRPYGDPVWRTLWPPFHFSCRTYVHGIYDTAELEAYGGAERAYAQGNYAAPAKGFGAYPLDKESYWRLTPEMADRAREYGIDGEIAAAAIRLGMPQYAMELVKGYATVYPASGGVLPSGGYVKASALAKPGAANVRNDRGDIIETDELGLAQKAADAGHEVFFLPATNNAKSPDVLIDGQVADIKHVFKASKRSIEDAIKRAREQGATLVLMEVPGEFSMEAINRQVEGRLRNSRHLQRVLVSWCGSLISLSK